MKPLPYIPELVKDHKVVKKYRNTHQNKSFEVWSSKDTGTLLMACRGRKMVVDTGFGPDEIEVLRIGIFERYIGMEFKWNGKICTLL